MKSISKITALLCCVIVLASCNDKTKRQLQYMPDTDMYLAVPYETYSADSVFQNGMAAQLPVKNTIARGQVPYGYSNSEPGYQAAKDSLRSPLWYKTETDSIYRIATSDLDNGKKMYDIYCASCHGSKGDGQGELVKREKFLGVPSYDSREITEGSIYHVIMHGRGIMGSHSSQLQPKERWQVVHYVEQLRNDLKK